MPRPCFALLLLLAACGAPSPDRGGPSATDRQAPADVDLSACAGRSMELTEFVKSCQQASGFNFTYAAPVGEALAKTHVRWTGPTRVARTEFQRLLAGVLEPQGFELRPVGPAHLRVLEIRRAGS